MHYDFSPHSLSKILLLRRLPRKLVQEFALPTEPRQPLKLRRGDWVPYRALCLALCLPLGLAWPTSLHAAPPTATEALSLRPVQANVEYDRVAVSEQSQCSVRDLSHEEWSGWEVVSPEGVTLRVFADTNGDKKLTVGATLLRESRSTATSTKTTMEGGSVSLARDKRIQMGTG